MITQIAITMAQWLITRVTPSTDNYPGAYKVLKESSDVVFRLIAENRAPFLTKQMNAATLKEFDEMVVAARDFIIHRPTVG